MRRNSSVTVPLDYLQQSPVRGQLEPYDERNPTGWRYIQCTDTPNELKILLPPSTANMYEQLLKAEIRELDQEPPLSWERILEIRHLKDRMIRKCQRLSNTSPLRRLGRGESFTFQSLLAPPDFRLKEMEKYLRVQQLTKRTSMEVFAKPKNSYCCSRCASGQTDHSSRATLSRRSSYLNHSSGKNTSLEHSKEAVVRRKTSFSSRERHPTSSSFGGDPTQLVQMEVETRYVSQNINEAVRVEREFVMFQAQNPPSLPRKNQPQDEAILSNIKPSSPPPLPHPFRGNIASIPNTHLTGNDPEVESDSESDSGSQEVSPPQDNDDDAPSKLRHRRSCLKRSNSSDVKTVSWAADRDWEEQLSNYVVAAREVKTSGQEWDQIRTSYLEQMAGLDALHRTVTESLERLHAETKQLEWVEEKIRDQREKLKATADEFERKQAQFRTKVQVVLEETENALTLCGAKRDDEF